MSYHAVRNSPSLSQPAFLAPRATVAELTVVDGTRTSQTELTQRAAEPRSRLQITTSTGQVSFSPTEGP